MAENGKSDDHNKDSTHDDQLQSLLDLGLDEVVAASITSMYKEGILSHEDLDQRALEALKEFDTDSALGVVGEMKSSDLKSVTNKSAYMCGIMKAYRQKLAAGITADTTAGADKPGPNPAKMQEILDRTGYAHEVTLGQRKYGGPPPGWVGQQPGAGFEVFCGKIPPTVFEDVLVPLFEKCGKIWDLRLMMDAVTGLTKTFCFVTFQSKEAAQKAVKELDGFEIRPGKKLKVNISIANVRLFIGNIPKNKTKEELQAEFTKVVDGLSEVIVYTNPNDPSKRNRGFAFLDFDSHKSAANARRRLTSLQLFGVEIVVNWADPQEEPNDEIMSKVKILYVRNLKADITEEIVKEKFEEYGKVERVKKFKDYCFVHYAEREHAMKAMLELDKTLLNTSELLITLAKPPSANKKTQQQQQFGAWAEPMMHPGVRGRGRGRGLRAPPAPFGGYHAAASYDPYGYSSYDYGYPGYGYEETDYYDSYDDYYDYGHAALAYPALPSVRSAGGYSMRGSRGTGGAMVRGPRGGIARGATFSARGGAQSARPAARGYRGGQVAASRFPMKRKAAEDGSISMPGAKRPTTADLWDTQPIAQQPLASENEWYEDTWA